MAKPESFTKRRVSDQLLTALTILLPLLLFVLAPLQSNGIDIRNSIRDHVWPNADTRDRHAV